MSAVASVANLFEGFWTYQTPISFLAGIGTYHIYCRLSHKNYYDEEVDVVDEREDPDV